MLTPANCGITRTHINVIQMIARSNACFIFVRPVNVDSTSLIEEGYRTKGLDIHAKSSNWGPMAGFICVDSTLSKVVDESSLKLERNRRAVRTALRSPGVGQVQLEISRARVRELVDKNLFHEYRPDCVFSASSRQHKVTARFEFERAQNDRYRVYHLPPGRNERVPLQVLGYLTGNIVVPVTADYDLFAICPHFSAPGFSAGNVTQVQDHGIQGVLSSFQRSLVRTINNSCGGPPVVNHGTELNNPYPENEREIAMFSPGGVHRMVPRLKLPQIFGDMCTRGFHVYVNPAWPVTLKAHIGARMSRLRNPATRGTEQKLEYLKPADFNLLSIDGYDEQRRRSVAMQKFGEQIANNHAAHLRPLWKR